MLRSARSGITILEVLVVVAIIGILGAIASFLIPSDRIAVTQAVERFERDIARTRFESVSANVSITFTVDPATNSYRAVPETGTVGGFTVADVADDFRGVTVSVDSGTPSWSFDARGVSRKGETVTLSFTHPRSDFSKTVVVNQYGRTRLP